MGGIELVAKMLSKAHMEIGDKVSVLSFGEGEKNYTGEFSESVTQLHCDIKLFSAPINLKYLLAFKSYLSNLDVDKIYVHLPNPYMHHLLWMNRELIKNKKIKLSLIYHSDIANHKFLGPLYDSYLTWTMGIYDEVICSSEKLWKSSFVLNKVSETKKRIIPFCIDGKQEFVHRKKFTGQLLSIGRFVPYKGFSFIINALKNTQYNLKIIGDGPLKEELERDIEKNLINNISLLGQVSDEEKTTLLDESEVLIVPSINRSEAYGMIIVEAFERGLPVIASDIDSGVTFLVESGVRGEVFEVLSKDSLLECLKKFEDEPALIAKYSKNGRDFFDQHLSYEKFKENISKL